MAFDAMLTLVDSYGRQSKKKVETTAATLADAITALGLYLTDLDAVTDLAVTKVVFTSTSVAGIFSGAAGSNLDTGATFKLLLDNGKNGAHKVPGFPAALVGAGGAIDPAGTEVAAYFANFLTGAACRLNDGQYVVSVVSGTFDK